MSGAGMGFIGVDTAHSSIMTVFPRWARHLGLPTRQLRGHDLPLDAPDAAYRELITAIARDETYLGALVTTHKIRVYEAAHDLFDELDDFSVQCGEVSAISKRGRLLRGSAKDPITAGLALREFLSPDHFGRTGAEVVCLGSGGAGIAISTYLAQSDDRPARVILTDVDQNRLDHVQAVHERAKLPRELFEYAKVSSPGDAAHIVEAAASFSLIVNATGLGKDRPGSPIPSQTRFPVGADVWEINYRGTLDFMHQARAQASERSLRVVDGWRYFIHGWTQVVAEVFDIPMPTETVEELSALAHQTK
jgi:shikimate dehydrogenase